MACTSTKPTINLQDTYQIALKDVNQDRASDQHEIDIEVFAAQEEFEDMETEMTGDQFSGLATDQPRGLNQDEVKGVKNASKGVTEGTAQEYLRLKKNFLSFLQEKGYVRENEEFFTQDIREDTPLLIVVWIMNRCDEINLQGQPRDHNEFRAGYPYAQKMRAAMTFIYGRDLGFGSQPFHYDKFSRKWAGNPALSETVGSYMVSLCRRKVRAGYVATSARALSSSVLQRMFEYNSLPKFTNSLSGQDKSDPDLWGGHNLRTLLHLGYTIAFICCLRSDELIHIEWPHILAAKDKDGQFIEITLPFRKTAQRGGIKPFRIYHLPIAQQHLCPVCAFANWVKCMQYQEYGLEGFVFRRILKGDKISSDKTQAMSSEQFLEYFRLNLLDLEIDSISYGTHSFRRGGCQWLHSERRWVLRRICDWAGWSLELTSLTIVKYLISWNDDPQELREHYFNPNIAPATKCYACGRQCHCN